MHCHLAYEQRCQISAYLSMNMSRSVISKKIGVHRSTITREIKRNGNAQGYDYSRAQEKANSRRSQANSSSRILNEPTITLIKALLYQTHASPEQIAGRLRLTHQIQISHQTIYSFIRHNRLLGGDLFKYLRRKGRSPSYSTNKIAGRGIIPHRVDISLRPTIVNKKERFGDFEVDTIVGAQHKGIIISIVDRATKITRLNLADIGNSAVVAENLIQRCCEFIKKGLPVHTITSDNGKEFARHLLVTEKTGAAFFFARPYKSSDRGLNEHTNGLVREFLPKGTDFTKVTPEKVAHIEWILNNRPRKSLNYKTPMEVVSSLLSQKLDLVAFQT